MKKILTLLLFVLPLSVAASTTDDEDAEFLARRNMRRHYAPSHELRLGVGAWQLDPTLMMWDGCAYNRDYYNSNNPSVWGNITNGDYYNGPTYVTGAISLSYGYNLKSWLYLGADFVYCGMVRRLYNTASSRPVAGEGYSAHTFTFMPSIRFTYVRGGVAKLYSATSLGVVCCYENYGKRYKGSHEKTVVPAFDFTFIGLSLGGRRVFGFAELGLGSRGVLRAGLGVRLGLKN